MKIVEGLCRGNVVYHAFQTKTPAEIRKQIDSIKDAKELKEKRKQIQEENVRRKKEKLQKAEEEIARVEDAAVNVDEGKDSRALVDKRSQKEKARQMKEAPGSEKDKKFKGRFNRQIAAEKEARRTEVLEKATTAKLGKRPRDESSAAKTGGAKKP